jgi:hypothetical protein
LKHHPEMSWAGVGSGTRWLGARAVETHRGLQKLMIDMAALIKDMLFRNVGPFFAIRLRACKLHPFRKEEGSSGVWPIAPGSALIKLASRVVLGAVGGL